MCLQEIGNGENDFPFGITLAKFMNHLPREERQIYRFPLELRPRNARQPKKILCQAVHSGSGIEDFLQPVGLLRRELSSGALLECLAESMDAPERAAQVMRDGIGESLQFLVQNIEGPIASLQIAVQGRNLPLRTFQVIDLGSVGARRLPEVGVLIAGSQILGSQALDFPFLLRRGWFQLVPCLIGPRY
jgi:hypothetical protein